jgi:NAD(P)-dependent dehydrogenase (short-subunit alcohol dehydrogenase family)
MGKLDGRTALITGGSSGIGLATAAQFIAEGARVIITGRRASALDAAQRELGDDAIAVPADAADFDDLDRLVVEAERMLGRIDIIVANAALNELAPFGSVTVESFDRLFDANVRGVFFSVQKLLPIMNDGGAIVVIGSTASHRHMPGHAVYAGTKGALRAFARNWAYDLLGRRIRVNVLTPGPTKTSMPQTLGLSDDELVALDAAIVDMVPMGRWGQPEDLAKAAVFLVSDDSSFMTGSELFVDGGIAQI